MTVKEFTKKSKFLDRELKLFKKQVDKSYTKIVREFIAFHSHVKQNKVYELKENGIKRKGFNRFVIYTIRMATINGHTPMIRVAGWWLDKNNVPAKWDTMTVTGVSNPAIFELSKNQVAEKHPDSDKVS